MAKDSLAKASTPEPFSTSRTSNWVARGGGLPDYIQHIAHDLVEKRGKTESEAIQMAIGIVKRWARGGGNVDANTRAAAAKAVAEWEKLKMKNAAKGVAKAVKEAILEAGDGDAEDAQDGGADEATENQSPVFCVKCGKKVKPTKARKCPTCGSDLSKAIKQAKKVQEAVLEAVTGKAPEASHPGPLAQRS